MCISIHVISWDEFKEWPAVFVCTTIRRQPSSAFYIIFVNSVISPVLSSGVIWSTRGHVTARRCMFISESGIESSRTLMERRIKLELLLNKGFSFINASHHYLHTHTGRHLKSHPSEFTGHENITRVEFLTRGFLQRRTPSTGIITPIYCLTFTHTQTHTHMSERKKMVNRATPKLSLLHANGFKNLQSGRWNNLGWVGWRKKEKKKNN